MLFHRSLLPVLFYPSEWNGHFKFRRPLFDPGGSASSWEQTKEQPAQLALIHHQIHSPIMILEGPVERGKMGGSIRRAFTLQKGRRTPRLSILNSGVEIWGMVLRQKEVQPI